MGGLAKGLAVIRAFSASTRRLSLSEIARSARIPAATARRCLLTLEELGYVTRNGRDFLLRPKVLELGAAYLESMNIEQLTKQSPRGAGAQHRRFRRAVRARWRRDRLRGAHLGTHAAAPGGARRQPLSRRMRPPPAACCWPASAPSAWQRYFENASLEALTERTVTDPAKLRALIEECRRAGYSAVEDELAYGVIALAVPVFDHQRARGCRTQLLEPLAPHHPHASWCASASRCCSRSAVRSPLTSPPFPGCR